MHQDLITALSHFTSALQHHRADTVGAQSSREKILEQSLIQQNQIVEMLQKMVASLEDENESSRGKISNLERRVHNQLMWKAHARLAEERLKEMAESSGVLGSTNAGLISFSALSSFEKALVEKDEMIASLQSKVERGGDTERVGGQGSSPSTRTKLAAERVRVMELEEELLLSREDSIKARGELAECQSDTMRRESEIQHLRHEMEAVKQVGHQQQDVVMGLRAALLDRDAQIASLTRALERTSEKGRKRSVTSSSDAFSAQNMFDLLLGRDVFNVELTRDSADGELGFSVSRIEMPISSRMSSLIVRAVKDGSSAQGLLVPGDEILEVNGLNCRNTSQKKAIEILERGKGRIKIVAAREQGPAEFVGRLQSTPIVSDTSQSTLWATANDASFAPISPSQLQPSLPTSPQHYHLSLPTSPSSAPPCTVGDVPLASHIRPQPIGQVTTFESAALDKPMTGSREESMSDSGKVDISELKGEVEKLREEAEQWQLLQAELEEELDATHSELEAIKMEHQLITAENFDLQQQLKSSVTELTDIQGQVEELQQLLVGVREKLVREEERTHALEQQNDGLHRTVVEANAALDHEKQRMSEVEEEILQLKSDSEREKSELSTKIATLQSQNEQLKADVKQRVVRLEAAQTQVREYENTLESERKECQQQIQQLKADLLALREQSAKAVSSSQIEVEKQRNQLTATKTLLVEAEKKEAEMKIEICHLRQAADESNKQLEELHVTYHTLKEKMSDVREQAESKTLQCESLTLGLKRAEGKLQANKDMSSRQQKEIDNLRRNNKRLLNERVRADEERSKAEVELKICRLEQAQMREKLQSQSGERDELFSELETLVAESITLQQQLDSARDKLAVAKGEKDWEQLYQQLEQLQRELDKNSESLQDVSGVKEGLESELLLERSKAEQLKASLAAMEATVESIETGKRMSDDLVASMSFVHEQDQARVKELEESLSTTQTELESIRLEAASRENERSKELQQLGAECASLKERIRGLSDQLDDEKEMRSSDVEAMKEKLRCSDQSVSGLQTELEAQESANSINQATISQLQTATEQAEEERARVQKSLQDALQRSHQLQLEADQLQKHSRQLETEKVQLCKEKESLSVSCADLKLSLKQASAQVDKLSAKLHVAEVNQAVTQQNLEEATLRGHEMKSHVSELEGRLHESEKSLEKAQSRAQEATLTLHTREEEISQLKTQMELSKSEQKQLQSSFIVLQTATKSQDKKLKSLEMERANLRLSVEQLEAAQDGLKKIVTSLEKEKAHIAEQQLQEVESLTQQLQEKVTTEKEQLVKIQRLERLHSEAQCMVRELLAAQEALKSSLTARGDEKEGDVPLREQLVALESRLVNSQQQASQAKCREEKLQTELLEATESGRVSSERLSELQDENEQLREEVEGLRGTETQLTKLHCKVDAVEESQRERNRKMVTMQRELEETTRELQSARTENEALLERVGEIAVMTVSLAERTAELGRVKGELAAEVKSRQDIVDEKEHLLGVLRRLEVEKHTAAMQPESPPPLQEADRDELLQAARDKEEEALRLREYVGKLLSAVVDKAPFVLERME